MYKKKWNGKGYDEKGNIIYELNNGTGKVKEYHNKTLILKEIIYLGKEVGREKNMMFMEI